MVVGGDKVYTSQTEADSAMKTITVCKSNWSKRRLWNHHSWLHERHQYCAAMTFQVGDGRRRTAVRQGWVTPHHFGLSGYRHFAGLIWATPRHLTEAVNTPSINDLP
jgi:hypothetical protein